MDFLKDVFWGGRASLAHSNRKGWSCRQGIGGKGGGRVSRKGFYLKRRRGWGLDRGIFHFCAFSSAQK